MIRRNRVLVAIEACIALNGSAKALAAKWGISEQYLCDVRKQRRAPGPEILKHLGLRAETVYFEY